MTIFELLSESVKLFADRTAVSHDGKHTTFDQLYRSSCHLADRLEKLSLPPGSPVGVLFENSVEYVIAFFAVLKAGFEDRENDGRRKALCRLRVGMKL